MNNLFTTSEPPKYLNSNSLNLCFSLLKGDKKIFSLVQKIFSTNKNVFLSPFNKQKQRFGELEFEYFGGSDVANKLNILKYNNSTNWTVLCTIITLMWRWFMNSQQTLFYLRDGVKAKIGWGGGRGGRGGVPTSYRFSILVYVFFCSKYCQKLGRGPSSAGPVFRNMFTMLWTDMAL